MSDNFRAPMSPDAALLIQVGTALFGETTWRAAVGRLVGRQRGQVSNWAAGREPVPPDVLPRLLAAVDARIAELRTAKAALKAA